MSKRSARTLTLEEQQDRMILAITEARCDALKCEDCEWAIFPGECKEYAKGGHCEDFQASFGAWERECEKAETEVHAGQWTVERRRH